MATQARFEQGGWYTNYAEAGPVLAASRVDWVSSQSATGKIAVAGCGWGYLVKALRDIGRDVYGFDAASYAILKYAGIDPTGTARVIMASVLNATQMTNFRRTTCGLSGSTKLPLMVSEDFLSALTDAEVTTALAQMRANATKVIHIITCALASDNDPLVVKSGDTANRSSDFIWRTHQAWKNRIGNSELVMNAEGGAVL